MPRISKKKYTFASEYDNKTKSNQELDGIN